MKISLVIPTLNEREAILVLFEGLSRVAQSLAPKDQLEVVLVDDGSTDGTVAVASSARPAFSLKIVERRERGLATAVLAGFAASSGEVLGVMDADLSHPPELIPTFVEALSRADIVVGSRHAQGGAIEKWPWYRELASQSATMIARPLGISVTDPMSGFFFLNRRVLEDVTCSPIGYKILLEILVKGQYQRVHEVPYTFRNREVGKSKMGMRETVNYVRHLGRLYMWKFFSR